MAVTYPRGALTASGREETALTVSGREETALTASGREETALTASGREETASGREETASGREETALTASGREETAEETAVAGDDRCCLCGTAISSGSSETALQRGLISRRITAPLPRGHSPHLYRVTHSVQNSTQHGSATVTTAQRPPPAQWTFSRCKAPAHLQCNGRTAANNGRTRRRAPVTSGTGSSDQYPAPGDLRHQHEAWRVHGDQRRTIPARLLARCHRAGDCGGLDVTQRAGVVWRTAAPMYACHTLTVSGPLMRDSPV